MKKTVELIMNGFTSSLSPTVEWVEFYRTFKSEFKRELKTIDGFNDIKFSKGHYYISGFFTINNKCWFFSTPDMRQLNRSIINDPNCNRSKMYYRTANNYRDYTGGSNIYVSIGVGMANEMSWNFLNK